MVEANNIKTRYFWVDNIKFACCILVVLGHTFSGLVQAGILKDGVLFNLFIQAVYTFHVPLFFVCSGFLYQKSNRVHTAKSWGTNALNKLLNLGVPYVVFTVITVVLKGFFSDSVNTQNSSGLLKTIFLNPVAPYWYLYVLFFLFLIIPCVNTKKQMLVLLLTGFAARAVYLLCVEGSIILPYVIGAILGRLIWFVIGMSLSFDFVNLKSVYSKVLMIISGVIAIVICLCFYQEYRIEQNVQTIIGLLFVFSIIILSQNLHFDFIDKLSCKFSEYFMPVYVMHTIFSAGLRSILLKLGIDNSAIHIICGLIAGFAFPILVYSIIKKIPLLQFFFYPKKAIAAMKRKQK